jgi:NAD(P)-dependent dehydrogenase (short-subunit alcohol dehydrogenase family)
MAGWLQGQVGVITGAARGIGRAVVERYLAEGVAGLSLLDRDGDALAELERAYPGQIIITQGNVADSAAHRAAVDAAVARFGRIDTLVANAGIFDFRKPISDYDPDLLDKAFDEMFHVNVRGYMHAALAARPHLEASSGSIIFTASVSSTHARGGGMLYVASKHAVLGLTRRLVRVNAVAPGGTLTQLSGSDALDQSGQSLADDPETLRARIAAGVPLGFAQESEDHAGAYVFLASRANARAITGEMLCSDGGMGVRGT